MNPLSRPAPRRRPANRRALIVATAIDLFATRGYENVSVGDIAEAVAVGPSALYRHFPGKADLLTASIETMAVDLTALAASKGTAADILLALATYVIDNRQAGVLWQRESRHLPPAQRDPLRDHLRGLRDHLAAATARDRPNVSLDQARTLTVAALAVIFSPSFHHIEMARPDFDELLARLGIQVISVDLPPAPAPTPRPPGVRPASKREQVVTAAMRLFADRTYASVGMQEIASAAGMATSTVYHHFASKADILRTGLARGTGYLQLTLDQTLATANDHREALSELVRVYARFAVEHPEMVDALITEMRSLGEDATAMNTAQREYVAEWVHLHRVNHPEVDVTTAAVAVQAALMVINDLARTRAFRARQDAPEVAAQLAEASLEPAQP